MSNAPLGIGRFYSRTSFLTSSMSANPRLQSEFTRYAAIQGLQAAQSSACNRLHRVEQRLARWLLMMRDRTHQVSLQITHYSLASILGTDRPSVSLAASALQGKAAIEYRRGTMAIVNHKFLEEATCECYQVMQELNDLLKQN